MTPSGGVGALPNINDPDLPTFTILLPNVKEKYHVLRALLESMSDMQYPKDRLQILLLVEHWDEKTQKMLGLMRGAKDDELLTLPPYASVVLSIPGAPGTKPSACDFGLYYARGDYTLIFDSEDSPDPQMLLKAVRDFRHAPPRVACLQARLLFWNILDCETKVAQGVAGGHRHSDVLRGIRGAFRIRAARDGPARPRPAARRYFEHIRHPGPAPNRHRN